MRNKINEVHFVTVDSQHEDCESQEITSSVTTYYQNNL